MSDALPSINWESVEEIKSMMNDKFAMMVQFFLEDTVGYLDTINTGLAADDASQVVSPAHTIKSSAKQLGADKLSEFAKKMENLSREISEGEGGDMAELKSLAAQLQDAFNEIEPEFKKLAEG
jgi:HPt (histidine-containing phosphotransfer) domain-containing protein